MVASIHDTRAGNQGSTESGDHDNKRPPNLTLCVQNVQLCGEVEREVEQSSKRYCCLLASFINQRVSQHTTAVPRGETLEAILQDVVVGLCADVDGYQCQTLQVNFHTFPNLASASCQLYAMFLESQFHTPIDEVRAGLSNCILQGARNCKGRAYTQAKTKNTAVQFPQAVLQPVPAGQTLDASPARRHGRLVGE